MTRLRDAKNKDSRRGRRNRRGGIIKKCNTYRLTYGCEIVVLIKDADGYDGFESRPGLFQDFTTSFPRAVLQTPEDLVHNDTQPSTTSTSSADSSAPSSISSGFPASESGSSRPRTPSNSSTTSKEGPCGSSPYQPSTPSNSSTTSEEGSQRGSSPETPSRISRPSSASNSSTTSKEGSPPAPSRGCSLPGRKISQTQRSALARRRQALALMLRTWIDN